MMTNTENSDLSQSGQKQQVRVVIIDYQSGNLHSAKKAIEKVVNESESISGEVIVTSDPETLESASHIILPGVGAFYDCLRGLESVSGMIKAMEEAVFDRKVKFLGICVGMQILAEKGYERGEHDGLAWLKGEVVEIDAKAIGLKLPQMGWNNVNYKDDFSVPFSSIDEGSDFYFVHSYHMKTDPEYVIATCDYGEEVTAAVRKDNILGVQFHPEKSQRNGLQLLQNFVEW
jgi:glutamine amidotransferase